MSMKRPPGGMTAAEFFTWLRNTGEYESFIERQRQQEKERQKRAIEWQRAPGAVTAPATPSHVVLHPVPIRRHHRA